MSDNCLTSQKLIVFLSVAGSLCGQALPKITSPIDGTVFQPGASFAVTVAIPTGFPVSQLAVTISDADVFQQLPPRPPFYTTVSLSEDIKPGDYELSLSYFVPGNIHTLNPIKIKVERPDRPITVTPDLTTLNMAPGQKYPLKIIALYNGQARVYVTRSTLTTFVSSASTIATVSVDGVITAVKPGVATIIATNAGVAGSETTVNVVNPVTVSVYDNSFYAGREVECFGHLRDVSFGPLRWSVSPEELATISPKGILKAFGAPRKLQKILVTATSETFPEYHASLSMLLSPDLEIMLSPQTANVSRKRSAKFAASVIHDIHESQVSSVLWSISPNVGTVDDNGLYTAPALISAPLTIVVTAASTTDSSKRATAKILLTPEDDH